MYGIRLVLIVCSMLIVRLCGVCLWNMCIVLWVFFNFFSSGIVWLYRVWVVMVGSRCLLLCWNSEMLRFCFNWWICCERVGCDRVRCLVVWLMWFFL